MSTAWERFLRVMSGDYAGSPSVAPLVAADHAAFIAGVPISQVVRSAKKLTRALLHAQRLYEGDFCVVFCDVNVEAEAMGCRLEFPENAPPHVMQACLPEELRSTSPQRDGRLPIMIEAAAIIAETIGQEVPVFASMKDPFSTAALACGAEDFLALLVSEPARARLAIARALENQRKYLEALLQTGAHIIIGAPLASGGVIGPHHFCDFVLAPLCELVAEARSRGRYVGVHICGEADPILDQLVRIPAHFLSLEYFNIAIWKKLVSDGRPHPALMGYFPTGLLLTGSDEEIKAEVEKEFTALQGHAHLFATACDVPQFAPPHKVQQFVQAARNISGKDIFNSGK